MHSVRTGGRQLSSEELRQWVGPPFPPARLRSGAVQMLTHLLRPAGKSLLHVG